VWLEDGIKASGHLCKLKESFQNGLDYVCTCGDVQFDWTLQINPKIMTLYNLEWSFIIGRWTRHFTGYNRWCLKNYGSILKNHGDFQSPHFHLQKTHFNDVLKTMSLSKSNKLLQERNLYLISFLRYSSGSLKMRHPVYIVLIYIHFYKKNINIRYISNFKFFAGIEWYNLKWH